MKQFFDTSVLISSFWRGHPQHESSLTLFAGASKEQSACALHTLGETYAVMTALPIRERIPTDQALLFIQEIRDRCTIVSLDESEYWAAIGRTSERGLSGGRIHDTLLLRCAAKVESEVIFTWNLKHFREIEPLLADRIRTPA